MPRPLTPDLSVDHLRKDAKRWLKAWRASDADARARLAHIWAQAPAQTGLRDIQYALALEFGFSGWTALKAAVDALERAAPGRGEPLQQLLHAAERGDAAAVRAILDRHPRIVDERGTLEGHTGMRTALHFGVGHEAVVRTLLDRGADPNIRDEGDNAFPLHFAAERGDLSIIRMLVEHGAETVAGEIDDHQLDVIGWATCFPGVDTREENVAYLLSHGARHTLHSAVAVGDVESIRARARENPSAIERPMDTVNRRRHALHLAVVKNQPASVDALLDLGADPHAVDAGGLTPLDEAALSSRAGMASTLIERGARLTLPAALALERMDDVQRLMRDDPDALKPGHSWAALIVRAAADAPAHVVGTLIRLGASVDVFDSTSTSVDETRGYTPLHAAAYRGRLATVELLLQHGANSRLRDSRYGGTPAGWASFAGHHDVFARLIAADIDMFDAIDFDRPDRIPEILRKDPEALRRPFGAYLPPGSVPPSWTAEADATPLVHATAQGKADAVRVLGSHGAEFVTGGHAAATNDERAAAFLRMACLDWAVGGPERARQTAAADRLLHRHPELARENIYTAVVCGDVDAVGRRLDERPALAVERGGPRQWPPILYLSTARLPDHPASAASALEIARLLLDRGADANSYSHGGSESIHYTVLTNIVGRGEEQATLHPEARALARLLLERGAEPYDTQVLYNGFAGHASHRYLADDDLVWLLDLIHEESLRRGRQADWQNPDWPMLGMGSYGDGAWYLLQMALKGNYLRIAEWVLAHGGNPNPPRATDPRTPPATLHEQAVRMGLADFAALLARYGAPQTMTAADSAHEFAAACARRDRARAKAMADANPALLTDPAPLFRAAELNQADAAALLLDLGMSPDLADRDGTRALHFAAYSDAADVVRILIDRGAAIDPRDDVHSATPIYWAWWGRRPRTVDILTPSSRDVWTFVPAGKLDRLREVLSAEPRLARVSWEHGTPLFTLPDDETTAAAIVELFLAHGGDLSFTRKDGATASRIARARGLDAAADLLERA